MRLYTSKLTPDSVVTYLFHDYVRSLWLFCLQYTPRLTANRLPGLCAMFEELTEFCLVFRFGFRASLLDFTSQIERLHRVTAQFV